MLNSPFLLGADSLKILLLPGFGVTIHCIQASNAVSVLSSLDPGKAIGNYILNRGDGMSSIENNSVKILAADDSSDNRFLLSAFLKGFDCELLMVENGQEALDTFKSGDFDIVLMDMQMPVLDGFAATRLIRQFEEENNSSPTPILALTAYSLPEEITRCTDAGCNGHISKPVRKKNLLRAIEDFVE